MKKIDKHIEIVSSSIASLCSMSTASRDAIQKSLAKKYSSVGVTTIDNEADLAALIDKKPDLVFLGMACLPRKATVTNSIPYIWLTDELHVHDICYTGSSSEAMALVEDKLKAKKIIKKADIPTPPFFMAYTGQFTSEAQLVLPFPLFIKPPKFSASIGINDQSIARNYREYKSKIAKLDKEFDSESLVETYLTGREFRVSVLKNSTDEEYHVMPLEVIVKENANGDKIIDHTLRTSNIEIETAPVTDPDLKSEISELALECFNALGAKDYGRIDIRCDKNGKPYFLGANLIPNIEENTSYYQKACALKTQLSFDDMLLQIVDLGFKGYIPYVAPVAAEPAVAK